MDSKTYGFLETGSTNVEQWFSKSQSCTRRPYKDGKWCPYKDGKWRPKDGKNYDTYKCAVLYYAYPVNPLNDRKKQFRLQFGHSANTNTIGRKVTREIETEG